MISQNTGIGIENNRDQDRPREYSKGCRGDDGRVFFPQLWNHEESVHKHGEKQELHMFPCGFVHRSKKTGYKGPACPFIEKMGKRTCDQNEKYSDDGVTF